MKTGTATVSKRSPTAVDTAARIRLGGLSLGGHYGLMDEVGGVQLVRDALALGITSFDTSPAFGQGKGEELLGRALADGAEDLRVGTTAIPASADLRRPEATNRETLLDCLEGSLRRLRREYIDLYYIQPPSDRNSISRLMEAVELVRESGLIRSVALVAATSYPLRIAMRSARVDAVLVPYNILNRPMDTEFLSFCKQSDVRVHAAEPLCRGFLTGRLHRNSSFLRGDIRSHDRRFRGEKFRKNVELVRQLAEYASQEGLTLLEMSLGWVLQHPSVSSAVCDASSREELREIIDASRTVLKLDQILAVDFIVGREKYHREEY